MQLLHGSPGGLMPGQHFCHILLITEGTAGLTAIPAAAPGHRERWIEAGFGGVNGGLERDEVRQEPRWFVTAGSRVLGASAGPQSCGYRCRCRCRSPPARRPARHGKRSAGTPYPARLPAPRAPAEGAHTDAHPRTDTRTDARRHAHRHLLDVLPDGGAVVADDEQLQGVIDEAVLRGRTRRWHGQAPGGRAAPSPAAQHPTPPCPSPRREATPPKHHPSPPKQSYGARLPASQGDSAPSLPPRARCRQRGRGPAPGRAGGPAELTMVPPPPPPPPAEDGPGRLTTSPGRCRPEWHPPAANGERDRCPRGQWRARPPRSPPTRGGGGAAGAEGRAGAAAGAARG